MTEHTLSDAIGAPPELAVAGYDQPWYQWQPGLQRQMNWPGGARTAVAVVLRLSAPEWETDTPELPRASGGRGILSPPDVPRMSHREFGHRVGVFRLLARLAEFAVAPAVAVDVLTAEHYRPVIERVLPVASEVLAAGMSATRPVSSAMSDDEERAYVAECLDRLTAATGTRPLGWIGPEHSESHRTPGLLADAGLSYVADWDHDDVPVPMPGAGPEFWSFPLAWELSDSSCAFHREMSPWDWACAVRGAFDTLHGEGGRMLALHLEPWLSGQAFRAPSVSEVLRHLRAHDDVWIASPGEIVAHCRSTR